MRDVPFFCLSACLRAVACYQKQINRNLLHTSLRAVPRLSVPQLRLLHSRRAVSPSLPRQPLSRRPGPALRQPPLPLLLLRLAPRHRPYPRPVGPRQPLRSPAAQPLSALPAAKRPRPSPQPRAPGWAWGAQQRHAHATPVSAASATHHTWPHATPDCLSSHAIRMARLTYRPPPRTGCASRSRCSRR
jgi:hypothetical protein